MSSNEKLENLLRSGLKAEPPDRNECEGRLRSTIERLQDAHNPTPPSSSRYRGLPPIVELPSAMLERGRAQEY